MPYFAQRTDVETHPVKIDDKNNGPLRSNLSNPAHSHFYTTIVTHDREPGVLFPCP